MEETQEWLSPLEFYLAYIICISSITLIVVCAIWRSSLDSFFKIWDIVSFLKEKKYPEVEGTVVAYLKKKTPSIVPEILLIEYYIRVKAKNGKKYTIRVKLEEDFRGFKEICKDHHSDPSDNLFIFNLTKNIKKYRYELGSFIYKGIPF